MNETAVDYSMIRKRGSVERLTTNKMVYYLLCPQIVVTILAVIPTRNCLFTVFPVDADLRREWVAKIVEDSGLDLQVHVG